MKLEEGKIYLNINNGEQVKCLEVDMYGGKLKSRFMFMQYGSCYTDFNTSISEYCRLYTKEEIDELLSSERNSSTAT
jgi:hypothetical protein